MKMCKGIPFVASYSGGKDSVLAIHRAVSAGMVLRGLIITYNTNKGRSWFHGIPMEVLAEVEKSVGVPVKRIETDGTDYNERFEQVLRELKEEGVRACVFGDIDIQDHLDWCIDRCKAVGLEVCHPLWQERREDLVRECIERGFAPIITVADSTRLPVCFLGRQLTLDVIDEIEQTGADVCGENGEYHTFVVDGPVFSYPIPVKFGEPMMQGNFGVLPMTVK